MEVHLSWLGVWALRAVVTSMYYYIPLAYPAAARAARAAHATPADTSQAVPG